jgi:hypothetical protein
MNRIFGRAKAAEPGAPPPELSAVTGRMDSRSADLETKIKGLDVELKGYKEQVSARSRHLSGATG